MLVLIQTINDFRKIRNEKLAELQHNKDNAEQEFIQNQTKATDQAKLQAVIDLCDFKQKNVLHAFCVWYWSKTQIGEYKKKQDEVNRCNKQLNKLTGGHSSVVGRWIFAEQLRLYEIAHQIPNCVAGANAALETAKIDKQNYKKTMSLPARVCATCIYGR